MVQCDWYPILIQFDSGAIKSMQLEPTKHQVAPPTVATQVILRKALIDPKASLVKNPFVLR